MKDSTFSSEQFSAIYPAGIERHYWNRARNEVIYNTIAQLNNPRVLDVGAGTGVVTSYLKNRRVSVWGVEVARVPVAKDLEGILYPGMDARGLPHEIRSQIDTVLLLDVVEHLADPHSLLNNLVHELPALRRIVVTVPARQELWNNFDVFNGHYLRYSRKRLTQLFEECGWHTRRCGYFFHALYWPALLFAACGLKRSVRLRAPKGGTETLHRIMGKLFFWEYKLLPDCIVGSSIIGVFERS